MSERPHKRRRIANPFIDVEAQATDDEESDVEEDQYLSIEEEMSDVDETQREESRQQLHLLFSQTEEEEEDVWANLIMRAETNADKLKESERQARARLAAHDAEPQDAFPSENYESCYLWEIGCEIGREETAVFKIYGAATNADASAKAKVVSAIGRSEVPGRIYVEIAATSDGLPDAQRPIVQRLARQVQELRPKHIRLLRQEERLPALTCGKPTHQPQSWVRFLGPLNIYKNDVGLLIDWANDVNDLYILLIPRIPYFTPSQKQTGRRKRVPARLLDKGELERRLGMKFPPHPRGLLEYQNNTYTCHGFLIIRQRTARLATPSQEIIPPPAVWDIFKDCAHIEEDTVLRTSRKIAMSCLALHNRVKVIRGPFLGLCGIIRELSVNEVQLYLYSQGIHVNVSMEDIRQAFEIGDHLLVFQGEHRNTMGSVVRISSGTVTLSNASLSRTTKLNEVEVPVHHVRFFDRTDTTTFRAIPPLRKKYYMGEFDPHRVHIGKRALIVGEPRLKGYKCFIKDTNAQGDAWVDVDAQLQIAPATVKLRLDQLVPLGDSDKVMGQGLAIMQTDQSRSFVQPPTPFPQPEPPRTPMPDASGSATPAWQPTSGYTIDGIAPVHPAWLTHPAFEGVRIKLVDPDYPSVILEFVRMLNPGAVVARPIIEIHSKVIILTRIRHVLPTSVDDQVVVTQGSRIGVYHRVISYSPDQCVIRQKGVKKSTKRQPDIPVPTSDLAQVFPVLK